MNDASDIIIFLENGERVIKIAKINFIVLYFFTGDFFNPSSIAGIGAADYYQLKSHQSHFRSDQQWYASQYSRIRLLQVF